MTSAKDLEKTPLSLVQKENRGEKKPQRGKMASWRGRLPLAHGKGKTTLKTKQRNPGVKGTYYNSWFEKNLNWDAIREGSLEVTYTLS